MSLLVSKVLYRSADFYISLLEVGYQLPRYTLFLTLCLLASSAICCNFSSIVNQTYKLSLVCLCESTVHLLVICINGLSWWSSTTWFVFNASFLLSILLSVHITLSMGLLSQTIYNLCRWQTVCTPPSFGTQIDAMYKPRKKSKIETHKERLQ